MFSVYRVSLARLWHILGTTWRLHGNHLVTTVGLLWSQWGTVQESLGDNWGLLGIIWGPQEVPLENRYHLEPRGDFYNYFGDPLGLLEDHSVDNKGPLGRPLLDHTGTVLSRLASSLSSPFVTCCCSFSLYFLFARLEVLLLNVILFEGQLYLGSVRSYCAGRRSRISQASSPHPWRIPTLTLPPHIF